MNQHNDTTSREVEDAKRDADFDASLTENASSSADAFYRFGGGSPNNPDSDYRVSPSSGNIADMRWANIIEEEKLEANKKGNSQYNK